MQLQHARATQDWRLALSSQVALPKHIVLDIQAQKGFLGIMLPVGVGTPGAGGMASTHTTC